MEKFKEKLAGFYRSRQRMPTFSELMKLWGYKTKSAVNYRIEALIEEGVISKDGSGKLLPQNLEEGVKMLGLVEAGFPSAAEEELLDVMNFDEYLTPNKEMSYILKVKGDSMIEAGIQPGDMVIVERRSAYKPGQIVIACIDSEYTMKYLRKRGLPAATRGFAAQAGEQYYLEPANKRYRALYPKESFRIEAVVTAVVRKY
ncbi:MAG: DNA polymerase V [Parcubacteria group bacterium Gr01-1014_8]|nr:MAG: DNA polymerase V [Parcubacteria group bacterium Gr01-1014_8]